MAAAARSLSTRNVAEGGRRSQRHDSSEPSPACTSLVRIVQRAGRGLPEVGYLRALGGFSTFEVGGRWTVRDAGNQIGCNLPKFDVAVVGDRFKDLERFLLATAVLTHDDSHGQVDGGP